MNAKTKVLENSLLYIISSLLVKAVGFLLLPIYTRYLLPQDYGVTNLFNGFINVTSFIVAFSLYSAVIRFYADYKEDPEKLNKFYSTIIIFLLVSGSTFIGLSFLFRNLLIKVFLKGISFYPIVVLAIVTVLFISLQTVHQNILQSMQKGKKITIINLVLFGLQVGGNLFFIGKLRMGATGVLLTTCLINVGYFIYMILDLKLSKLISLRFDRHILKEALAYSIPIMPHNLSTQIASFASQIFVNNSGSLASVGLYGIAFQFSNIIDMIQSAVNQAFAPWFYDMMNTSKIMNKKSIVSLSDFLLILYSLMYMGIGLFSQEVILLMTNEKYVLAWTVIPILVVGFSLKSIYYFYVNILFYYKNAAKKIFISTLSGSFADIFIAFFLIPYYGMYGAAISFMIAKMIVVIIVVCISREYNDIGYRVKNMLKIILPSLLFMGTGLIFSYTKYMEVFRWSNLFYKIMIFTMYLGFIFITNKEFIKNALAFKKREENRTIDYYYHKIKDHVYYVEKNNQKYIIKTISISLFQKILDYAKMGKYQAFKNEINFYKSIESKSFQRFQHPQFIQTDNKSYMALEYIRGLNGWDRYSISDEEFMKALLEFQFCGIKVKSNYIWKLLVIYHGKVPSIVIRWSFKIIKSPSDIKIAVKCIFMSLKYSKKLKKIPYGILTHNNLSNNKIISGDDHCIYFLDFEHVMVEYKWILIDTIDICFDLKTLTFDKMLFTKYMRQLSRERVLYRSVINNVYAQVRVIIMKKILGILLTETVSDDQKHASNKFLKYILLLERNYILWYRINVNSDIETYQLR